MLHLGIESMGLGQLFSISAPWDTFVLEINHELVTKHLPASDHLGSQLPKKTEHRISLRLLTLRARRGALELI